MTPSQRKTALFLERLVQGAASTGERCAGYASSPDSVGDVELDLRVGGRRVGLAKITPIGRPYWPEER